ncbi:hypothetical protein Dimus_021535 [Dionaea muscipula]
MEESESAIDVWMDFELSPKRLCSAYVYDEPCFAKQDVEEVLSGGDRAIGVDDDVRELENSKPWFQKEKVEECGNGISTAVAVAVAATDCEGTVKSAGSSIAERRAAKFGFNASNINTPRFRTSTSLASPSARSPYLTIPPGISPTMLLDSPILLPNSQPSPTTGTFAVRGADVDSTMVDSTSHHAYGDKGCDGGPSLTYNPYASAVSLACVSWLENQTSRTTDMAQSMGVKLDGCAMASALPHGEFEFAPHFPREDATKNINTHSPVDIKVSNLVAVNPNPDTVQLCDPNNVSGCEMSPEDEPSPDEETIEGHSMDLEHKGTCLPVGSLRTSDDGYSWRKYGQKQVKGSEYPRSYYKCTHPSCPVKKKIERAHDGQITEIIYKGAHSHPKPQPNRRSTFGSVLSFSESSETSEGSGTCVKADGGQVWRSMQYQFKDMKVGTEWRADGLDSTSGATEVSDPMSTTQGNLVGAVESAGAPELSPTIASQEDEEEDAATQGSMLLGDDDDNESDSKRRKREGSFTELTHSSRAVREPRVVVQIESEIDILDDGYRWRKYGQKVVKGNPNPRSYYKCTSAGCTVRKHVERASHNLKYVITTYEGKHNHDVPVARNSSHTNSSGVYLPRTAPNTQATLTLPRNANLPKPEPQDLAPYLDRQMGYHADFLRPNYLGNLGGGASSFYPMKFPTFPSATATPYGSFEVNLSHSDPYPSSIVPGLSIPLPFGLPHPSNLTVPDWNNHNSPLSGVQTFLARQEQLKDSDMKFLRPKQETRDESVYDASLSNTDDINTMSSSSPSV